MVDVEEIEQSNGSYFNSFMREVERELKKGKTYYVFNQEQVDYIKEIFKDKQIKVRIEDDIYYLSIVEEV